jgi:HEAT repeat protein
MMRQKRGKNDDNANFKRMEPQAEQAVSSIILMLRQFNRTDIREHDMLIREIAQTEGWKEALIAELPSNDPASAKWAAKMLGYCRVVKAREPLESALSSWDDELRIEAAKALGLIGDISSIPSLVRASVLDIDPRVRDSAMIALGFYEEHYFITVEPMFHDENPAIRAFAAELYPVRLAMKIPESLKALAYDNEARVRRNAIRQLRAARDISTLRDIAFGEDGQDLSTRGEAIYQLGFIGGESAAHVLIQIAQSADDPLRYLALNSLKFMERPELGEAFMGIIPKLEDFWKGYLKTGNRIEKAYAREALARMSEEDY